MDTPLHKFCVGANLSEDHRKRFMERALQDNITAMLTFATKYNAKHPDRTLPSLAIIVAVCPPPVVWDVLHTLWSEEEGGPNTMDSLMKRNPEHVEVMGQLCTIVAHLADKKFGVYFLWTTDGKI
eukprot:PhF_6_TR18594/c0_g1_i1/m.27164